MFLLHFIFLLTDTTIKWGYEIEAGHKNNFTKLRFSTAGSFLYMNKKNGAIRGEERLDDKAERQTGDTLNYKKYTLKTCLEISVLLRVLHGNSICGLYNQQWRNSSRCRAVGIFVTVFTSTVFDYRQVYELFLGEQKTNLRMQTKKQQQKPTLITSSTVHPCLLKKRNSKWFRKR